MNLSATHSGPPLVQIEATPFDFSTIQDEERFKTPLVQIQDEEEMQKEEQAAMQRILESIHRIAAERRMSLEHARQAELAPAEKITHEIQSELQEAMTDRVLMEIEATTSQPLVYLQPELFPTGHLRRELDNERRGERATGAGPAEAAVISVEIDAGPAQQTPGPHMELLKDSAKGAERSIYSYDLPSVPPDLPLRLREIRREAAEGIGDAASDFEVQQQQPTGVWQVWGEGAGAREEGSRGAYGRDRQGEF